MSNCNCQTIAKNAEEKTLKIALGLNFFMFVLGFAVSLYANSTALMADSLDMLADAFAYFLGLLAIGRAVRLQAQLTRVNGVLLFALGLGMLFEVGYHWKHGHSPDGLLMLIMAFLSLLVNATVLILLGRFIERGIHIRATWIFTRADVIANIGVIISALLVMRIHSHYPDLIVGSAISIYIMKEAIEIMRVS